MSSKKKSKIIIGCFLLTVSVCFLYNYLYQDHRNIQQEAIEISIPAPDLVTFFKENKSEKVLNKTIEVTGLITDINPKSLTLDNKVQCSFEFEVDNLKLHQSIQIKGRCIGFDELFEIVKMDQSFIIK